MRETAYIVTAALLLSACSGDTGSPGAVVSANTASSGDRKTEISSPPDPCTILTPNTAQAELGAADLDDVEPAPDNGATGDGSWSCAYTSGDARISLSAEWSGISSGAGADAAAAAYGRTTGQSFEPVDHPVYVVIRSADDASTTVAYWSGLARLGDQSSELVIRAEVADPTKQPTDRAAIANALADYYLLATQQAAMMGIKRAL